MSIFKKTTEKDLNKRDLDNAISGVLEELQIKTKALNERFEAGQELNQESLQEYVKQEFVEKALKELEGNVDSKLSKKAEAARVEVAVKKVADELREKIDSIQIPSVEGLATDEDIKVLKRKLQTQIDSLTHTTIDKGGSSVVTVRGAISNLRDIELTGLANGEILIYNATTSKWENGALPDPDLTPYARLDGANQPFTSDITADSFIKDGGTSDDVLLGDGSTTSLAGIETNPAGSDTQVQYNDSGSFGASANFTFDGTRSFKMGDATGLNIGDGTGIYSAGYNIGRNNEVANADAFVFGKDNDPLSSFTGSIVGLTNSSDITGSTILGQTNTINNVPNSTIVGINNNLSKGTSVIMTATATVVGFQNTVTGGGFVSSQQVVVGNLNTSSSSQACVFGVSLTNSTANSVMLGFSTANVLFTVANGAVFSSGQKVNPDGSVFLPDVAAAPATPTGGGVMYVEAGALKYKGSSGTVTVLGVS